MFALKKIREQIYLLTFDDSYDLTMHFLRYQEFYESPNKKFQGKKFTIIDFMEWYSKDNKGRFTYPTDWSGFNVPSKIFEQIYALGISDENKYDRFMKCIYEMIRKDTDKPFYLMGAVTKDKITISHEMAHSLWYTDKKYKKLMANRINKLPKKAYKIIEKILIDLGYIKRVIPDEIQAYLGTDLDHSMIDGLKAEKMNIDKITKPFVKIFKKYEKNT